MRLHSSAIIPAVLCSRIAHAAVPTSPPTATISGGVVIGTAASFPPASSGTPAAINKFLGVPFAAPPKRFSVPKPAQPWTQPLKTQKKSAACIQEFAFPEPVLNLTLTLFNTPAPEESEDCLYLNVYAPATPAPKGGRAVLFWIYGGGLYFGDASHAAYDGSYFAAYEDVVVVAANYRTNVFGFPASSEIPSHERNLGFLDQRFALEWVQQNIHAFGGDSRKVTIFGESAGSFSVDALLTSFSKHSSPPFRAAIMQSGQISYRGSPNVGEPYPDTITSWNALGSALNCGSVDNYLKCISKAPAATIKTIIERDALLFWPHYDNKTLVSDPSQRRISGNVARIPILSGTNADEGRFIAYGQTNLTAYLETAFGPGLDPDFVASIEAAYPVGTPAYPTIYDALAQIDTEISFQCGAALVANDTAAAGIPSWRYYFNASFPNTQGFPNARAYHSSEIQIVFSTYPRENATTAEHALSNLMRSTWAKFAKNPELGPGWNVLGKQGAHGVSGPDIAVFSSEAPEKVGLIYQNKIDDKCAFWSKVLKSG